MTRLMEVSFGRQVHLTENQFGIQKLTADMPEPRGGLHKRDTSSNPSIMESSGEEHARLAKIQGAAAEHELTSPSRSTMSSHDEFTSRSSQASSVPGLYAHSFPGGGQMTSSRILLRSSGVGKRTR